MSILNALKADGASRPFLKWAGGKAKLASFIAPHLPQKGRLVEPFVGSAALSLALEFDAYWFNDINADLMGVYHCLKQQKGEFITYAQSFFTGNNTETAYYELRERFNGSDDPFERSALFIYLNRHGFNGLCRYNAKGGFNVPFGRYKAPMFPLEQMTAFIAKSDRVELSCLPYQDVLTQVSAHDAVYCDPPYVALSQTASFTAYAKGGFGTDEQEGLATLAKSASHTAQTVLISNHDTPYTRQLYQGAVIYSTAVRRNISAKGSSRKMVDELLAVYQKG